MTEKSRHSEIPSEASLSVASKKPRIGRLDRARVFFRAKIAKLVSLSDAVVVSKIGKYVPAAVLATSLATTAQIWKSQQDAVSNGLFKTLENHAVDAENSIVERMRGYGHILVGVRGLFSASSEVGPKEFREYVRSLQLPEKYPEIQGISISYHTQSEAVPISMIEPQSRENSRLTGYDNFSNSERKTAMESARDTDSVVLSGKLRLSKGASNSNSDMAMFLPMYRKGLPHLTERERRENITGWIAASFRMEDFVPRAAGRHFSHLDIEIYEGAPHAHNLIYDSHPEDVPNENWNLHTIRKVEMLDKEWTIVSKALPELRNSVNAEGPKVALAIGIPSSFLLASFFFLLIRGRENMLNGINALRKSSEELRRSEIRYKSLFRDGKIPMLVIDPNSGNIVDANLEASEFYGHSIDELRLMTIVDLNGNERSTATERLALVKEGKLNRFEAHHVLASGDIRDVEISASHIEMEGKDRILQIVSDISERKSAVEKIMKMATHDDLTGLPNRSLFVDRLSRAFANADRNGKTVALMFIDLDHFKVVNDSMGHDVGDALLREVTARMRTLVRGQDTVARQGGDEFLVILPNLDEPSNAWVVAEKIVSALSKPFHIRGHELHIGASIGIASYPRDAKDVDTLMKYGDIAMYRVKGSGRQGYRFFSPEMHALSVEHQSIANALHHAIDRQEFHMEYQPIVKVSTGKMIAMETLIRWQHPEFWKVSPEKFIPIAEDSGLIVSIGEWIIRDVCRQISEWRSKGHEVPRVAINLSARQFRSKTLVEDILKVLQETETSPNHIGLEITESMLVDDVESVVETLSELERHGIEVSIDDFWTGYSSLSYLKRFPVKKLKIDRSFVRDLAEDADDLVIVKSIVDLAHNLGLRVVAEGVENEAQLSVLRDLKCDCAQGYFFSRPISAEALEKRLPERPHFRLVRGEENVRPLGAARHLHQ